MKIAVTSQNRSDITQHAGRCRNFRIFEVVDGRVTVQSLLELPKEASFHESPPDALHPLDDVDLLIAGGMGKGLQTRLARKGIVSLVTSETDPETAVRLWLAGDLPQGEAHAHGAGSSHERHSDCGGCGCG
jgi:predicted Fe-Mo cluster-binding NifX family protein